MRPVRGQGALSLDAGASENSAFGRVLVGEGVVEPRELEEDVGHERTRSHEATDGQRVRVQLAETHPVDSDHRGPGETDGQQPPPGREQLIDAHVRISSPRIGGGELVDRHHTRPDSARVSVEEEVDDRERDGEQDEEQILLAEHRGTSQNGCS